MSKLIFGCGYLGSRVARLWRNAGDEVYVVTRSPAKAKQFADDGYRPIVADVLRPETLTELPAAHAVLYAVGYDRSSGHSIGEVYVDGLQTVLAALPGNTPRVIYISSTGVYGQAAGERVDEQSPTHPTREGGRACLAAERALAVHPLGHRAIVLRMAGLYGPGRIPLAAAVQRGEAISAPVEGSLNLIHIDDAATVVLAAEQRAAHPRTYVVSDGHPAGRRAFYEQLARLLGLPSPRFVTPSADAPRSARAGTDKRVDNRRMLAELEVTLAYPTFREGLAAIVAAENAGPQDS